MVEEEASYKQATKAVDDAMRWDLLGPKVVEVLVNYAPAKEHIEGVVLKSLQKDGDIKKEVNTLIDEHAVNKKGKSLSQFQAIALTGVITTLITVTITLIAVYFFGPAAAGP